MENVYTIATLGDGRQKESQRVFARLACLALQAAGGRLIGRGRPLATMGADPELGMVLMEWDSLEQALAAFESKDYRVARACLGAAAERDIRIIKGLGRHVENAQTI